MLIWNPYMQNNSYVPERKKISLLVQADYTSYQGCDAGGSCSSPQETHPSSHSQPLQAGSNWHQPWERAIPWRWQTLSPCLPKLDTLCTVFTAESHGWYFHTLTDKQLGWVALPSRSKQHKLCHIKEIKSPALNCLQEYTGVLPTLSSLTGM